MKRILVTGMSGTGKSTVIRELDALGFRAVDLDGDEFSHWVEVEEDSESSGTSVEKGRDWVWREDRILELLTTDDAEVLFLSGCSPNMGQCLGNFDHVVLL